MKKGFVSLFVALAVLLSLVSGEMHTPVMADETVKPTYEECFSEVVDTAVSGTDYDYQDGTYTVYTALGLAYSTSNVDDYETIVLANDIDLSERYWDCGARYFDGVTFDGNNKTISGLIMAEDEFYFLNKYSWDAVFKDLTIDCEINSYDGMYLLSYSSSDDLTVENVTVNVKGNYVFEDEDAAPSILFEYIDGGDVNINGLNLNVDVDFKDMMYVDEAGLIAIDIYGDNINLQNINITGNVSFTNSEEGISEWEYFGGIAGSLYGYNGDSTINLENVNVEVDYIFNGETSFDYFGGLFGYVSRYSGNRNDPSFDLKVNNCSYNGNMTADCVTFKAESLGGLFGYIERINNVVITGGSVSGELDVNVSNKTTMTYLGGLAGYINSISADINGFSSDFDINVKSEIVADDIRSQYKYGDLYTVGTIAGYLNISEGYNIEDCNFAGDINLTNQYISYISGLVGCSFSYDDSGFQNCDYTGNITLDHVGGISYVAGYISYAYQNYETYYMYNCNYVGNITLQNGCDNVEDIAGLLGRTYTNVNMVGCTYLGDITVNGSAFNGTCGYVGGLIGRLFKDTEIEIVDSNYEGDIVLKGDKNIHMVGGLIAYYQGDLTIKSTTDTYVNVSALKNFVGFDTLPSSIKVQLYACENPVGEVVELSEANQWSYNWGNLPLPLEQAKEVSEGNLTYHKGDIIIEDTSFYRNDELWVGGLVGDHEGNIEVVDVYQVGDIIIKNCDGLNKAAHIGSWFGGCGNTDKYDCLTTTTPANSYSINSYCVGDITIDNCQNVSKLYLGGLIGSSIKDESADNFENFYYEGNVSIDCDGEKSVGLLFGAISEVGTFYNFNYNSTLQSSDIDEVGLCGNMDLDEEVLSNIKEDDSIGSIITSTGYLVKELDPVDSVVTYENDVTSFTITNTYQKETPATGDSKLPIYLSFVVAGSLIGVAYFQFKKKKLA